VCPGETDAVVLENCAVDSPCPEAFLSSCDSPGVECLLSALRDRTPGRYEFSFDYPNQLVSWRLVVDGNGDAQATYVHLFDIACATGIWQPARACRLADPQVFTDCLVVEGSCIEICFPDQFSLTGWLVDCVDMPASCP